MTIALTTATAALFLYMNENQNMNKNDFRILAKKNRDSISDAQRDKDAISLGIQIKSYFKNINASKVIGSYSPINSEIKPLLDFENMALPVVCNKTEMQFYAWNKGENLTKAEFNIPTPDIKNKKPIIPDYIIMPLLACDKNGNRVGYGAGCYDRYLNNLKHKPTLIGICFDTQIYEDALPYDKHDVRMNVIITPTRIIKLT